MHNVTVLDMFSCSALDKPHMIVQTTAFMLLHFVVVMLTFIVDMLLLTWFYNMFVYENLSAIISKACNLQRVFVRKLAICREINYVA